MNRIHRNSFIALIIVLSGNAFAAAPVAETIAGNPALTTVYTLDDYKVLASAFNAVASFFGGGAVVGDSFMGQLMLLASVISLFFFIAIGVGKLKLNFSAWFLTMIFAMILFMPKTTVYVTSYFGESGGTGIGPTAFEAVDNVPIGVAYPLGITSFVFKELTMRYDTWSTTPGGPADDGGFAEKGLEGYFSPLKTMLRVQKVALPPEILQNIRSVSTCDGMNGRVGLMGLGGVEAALNHPDSSPPISGITRITVRTNDGMKTVDTFCSTAIRTIWAQMQAFINKDATGSSPLARSIITNVGMGEAMGTQSTAINRARYVQQELDGVIKQLMTSAEVVPPGNQPVVTQTALDAAMSVALAGGGNSAQIARAFENFTAVSSTNIMANAVFARVLAACGPKDSNDCAQAVYSTSEATTRASMNAAGEASVFSAFMTHAANAFIYIFVILTPIVLMVAIVMGVAGLKIISAYLLLAVWVNSWLPTAGAISAYMLHNFTNQVERIGSAANASLLNSGAYTIPSLLLPSGMNDFIYSTTNMLGSASTLLASVPLITLAVISGSIFGLVGVANKMNMPDSFNEDRLAPNLETSPVVGSKADIGAAAKSYALGENSGSATSNASAMSDQSIDFSYNANASQQVTSQLSQQVSAAKEHAEAQVSSFLKSHGSTFVSMDGKNVTFTDSNGATRQLDYTDQKDVSKFMNSSHAKDSAAAGAIKLGISAAGSGAATSAALGESRSNATGSSERNSDGTNSTDGHGQAKNLGIVKNAGYQQSEIDTAVRSFTSSTSDTNKYLTALAKQEAYTNSLATADSMTAKTSLNGADAQRVVAQGVHTGSLSGAIQAASAINPEVGSALLADSSDATAFTQRLFGSFHSSDPTAKAAASAAVSEVAKLGTAYEPGRSNTWSTIQNAASQNAGLVGETARMENLSQAATTSGAIHSAEKAVGLKPQQVSTAMPGQNTGSGSSGSGRSGSGNGSGSSGNGGSRPDTQKMTNLINEGTDQVQQQANEATRRTLSKTTTNFGQGPVEPAAPEPTRPGDPNGVIPRAVGSAAASVKNAFSKVRPGL